MKLYPRYARTNVTLNYFANRVVNIWNALPEYVVRSPSLIVFKKRLEEEEHILHQFLCGRAFRNQ